MAYVDLKRWSLGTVCIGAHGTAAVASWPADATTTDTVLGKIQFGTPVTGTEALTSVYIPHGMNVVGLEVFYQTAADAGPLITVVKGTIDRTTGDAADVTLISYDATGGAVAAAALAYTAVDPSTTAQTNVGVRDGFEPYDGGTSVTSFAETLSVVLATAANAGANTAVWACINVLYT